MGTNLKLPFTDVDFGQEPVHDVAGEEEHINVALLITTNLIDKEWSGLSINLKYLISACAVKLEQINLLLWATMSLDFIT